MSRYIDADALKKRVSELIVPDWTRTLIRSWLDSEPTVDAVPVVRCRDCLWRHDDSSPMWLPCMECQKPNDWFCADGERRTDGNET